MRKSGLTIVQYDCEAILQRFTKSSPDLSRAVATMDSQQHWAMTYNFEVQICARNFECGHGDATETVRI